MGYNEKMITVIKDRRFDVITSFWKQPEKFKMAYMRLFCNMTMDTIPKYHKRANAKYRRTGNTQKNWSYKIQSSNEALIQNRVHTALYLEHGTGIHGPEKRLIKPVHGQYMVFNLPTKVRKGVFLKWNMVKTPTTKGQKGQHIVRRSINFTHKSILSKKKRELRRAMFYKS